jgi:hypothetical protein
VQRFAALISLIAGRLLIHSWWDMGELKTRFMRGDRYGNGSVTRVARSFAAKS